MFGVMHLGVSTTQKRSSNSTIFYKRILIKMMFRISFISQVCVHKEFDCAEKKPCQGLNIQQGPTVLGFPWLCRQIHCRQ